MCWFSRVCPLRPQMTLATFLLAICHGQIHVHYVGGCYCCCDLLVICCHLQTKDLQYLHHPRVLLTKEPQKVSVTQVSSGDTVCTLSHRGRAVFIPLISPAFLSCFRQQCYLLYCSGRDVVSPPGTVLLISIANTVFPAHCCSCLKDMGMVTV